MKPVLFRSAGRLAELALCFAGGGCFAAALPAFELQRPRAGRADAGHRRRGPFALEIRGAGRLRVGRRLVALRLPFPARNRPGDPVPDAVGHFALAGLLGGVPAVPLAEHALSARGRTRRYEARKRFLTEPAAFGRLVLFAFGAAALYTLFEWTRSRLFRGTTCRSHVAEYSASSDRVGHRPLRNHVRPGLLRRCAGRSRR